MHSEEVDRDGFAHLEHLSGLEFHRRRRVDFPGSSNYDTHSSIPRHVGCNTDAKTARPIPVLSTLSGPKSPNTRTPVRMVDKWVDEFRSPQDAARELSWG
jgi:hypothetical protein